MPQNLNNILGGDVYNLLLFLQRWPKNQTCAVKFWAPLF